MKVAIIMGSDSDWPVVEPAAQLLAEFGIETEVIVASAHRPVTISLTTNYTTPR